MSFLRASILVLVLGWWSQTRAQPAPAVTPTAAEPTPSPAVSPPTPPPTTGADETTPVATETPASADEAPASDDELGTSELGRSGLLSDEQVLFEERYGYGDLPSRQSPHELADHSYWSFGFAYRHSFVPRGLVEIFVARAPSGIDIPTYQFEVGRRRNGVDVIMGLSYSDFSFHGPFRSSGDNLDQTEIMDSSLRAVTASATMLWSSNFSDVFALQYGFDAGLGVMFGDIVRTEAYPSSGGPHTRDGWAACVGPNAAGAPGSAQASDDFDSARYGAPLDTVDGFCGAPNDSNPAGGFTDADGHKGEHYGVRSHNLLQGGNVPFFSWRLAPRLSLRIKPIHQIVLRLDVGFDFGSGIFLGAGAHYGF